MFKNKVSTEFKDIFSSFEEMIIETGYDIWEIMVFNISFLEKLNALYEWNQHI